MPTLPYGSSLTFSRFDDALDATARVCDLRPLRFIDAYGLVGTACALRCAFDDDPNLTVLAPDNESTREHLAAMGLRDFLALSGRSSLLPSETKVDAPTVVVPLRSTSDSLGAEQLSHLLWGQLHDKVDPQVLQAVTEGVWEIVGNALEHSGSDALIMGQVYRADRGGKPPDHEDTVQVVVGDVGRGILASFLETGVKHPQDDIEAIGLALEYLVTSVPDDPGRGQGLSTTLEQVLALGGRMIVRSGAGKIVIDKDGRHDEHVRRLPGVLVAVSLPLYPG
jgi:hypothetical protein